MIMIKYIVLLLIFFISMAIGFLLSKRYTQRVIELREIKNFLNILKTKIKFTYEPLPEILEETSENFSANISNFIKETKSKMNFLPAGDAWQDAIEESSLSINQEDKSILKKLGNLLGKTNIEGQISEIEVTESFLNKQIEKAEEEKKKNEKMYKTLGVITGLGLVIILI